MLRLYPVALDWLASLRPVIAEIERADRHLADQLRRSSTSVCLHIAEGMGQRDGRRRNAYRIALGEVREAVAECRDMTRASRQRLEAVYQEHLKDLELLAQVSAYYERFDEWSPIREGRGVKELLWQVEVSD